MSEAATTPRKGGGGFLGLLVTSIAVLALMYAMRPHGAKVSDADIQRGMASPSFDGTYPCVSGSIAAGGAVGSLGRCAMPTARAGAVDAFEVDLRYGRFVLRQTDLRLNGVFDIPLTRSYASDDWVAQNRVHAFGINTNHPYDIAPVGSRNPYSYMLLALEDGDFLYFKRISAGTGFADAVFLHTETSTRFYGAVIHWNGDGWTLRLADGSEMQFPEAYQARNLAQGAATEIRDAAGRRMMLKRDRERDLKKILTPHDHWIKFDYDEQARIVNAADDHGESTRYGYNRDGMLTSAINSSGRARYYEYAGHLMTAVYDEGGRVLLRNRYLDGLVIRQEYGNGDVFAYSYTLALNRTCATSVVVTLPDHSTRNVVIGNTVPSFLLMGR